MTEGTDGWSVRISVRTPSAGLATWLERALRPESTREVPRARAELLRPEPTVVEIAVSARDTGAVRAAMNTYLGWVHLALATVPPAMGESR